MKKNISIYTLIALVSGIIAGLVFKNAVSNIAFIGSIYINLLKFLIGPVIFTSIIPTIYASANRKDRTLIKAITTYVLMFLATYLLMSLLVMIINPAKDFSFPSTQWSGTTQSLSIQEIIINLFPTNIITIFLETKLFAIIMFAYILGVSAAKVNNGGKLVDSIIILRDVFFKILEYIMYITPFAAFSLISNTIANYGAVIIGVGLRYIAMAYLGGLFTILLIMILPVWILAKIDPISYIRKVYRVWLVSLTTCSSAATLPTTMKVCKEQFAIRDEIVDVVSPLGCTIHMCGGAVSFALLGLFCSKLYGIDIDLVTYLIMIVSALLINMSAPGIPNGGVVIGATYLQLLGIPLDFIGLYSGMYKILDMLYTTLNVTGNITANVIISKLNEHE